MRLTRRALLTSTMAAVAAAAALRLARADAPLVTLKLHHHFSAVSAPHEKFLAPWARKVEAESGGRIRIELFPSMQLGGAPAQLFDQAREGIADIVWAVPGSTPGRFAKIEVFELPFVLSGRALVNSKAIEDYAAVNLQDEFHEIHPLCFSCRDHGILHTTRSIKSIDDLKDLRLHVPNRLAGDAVHALGAARRDRADTAGADGACRARHRRLPRPVGCGAELAAQRSAQEPHRFRRVGIEHGDFRAGDEQGGIRAFAARPQDGD
jgi:TRAP-type C4-dicarboxylate transport system substrate-binding protein